MNGQQRPRSIPTLADRARQAVSLQALQPIAETTAAQDSYGFRPKRRGAEAIDQSCKILRQTTSASWILAGDIQGCFDNKVQVLGQQRAGNMPAQLIGTLNPALRGWANDHRHAICGSPYAQLDSFVWRRLCRWAKRRHLNHTGRWIATRDFPHDRGQAWRCTDPGPGTPILRLQEAVKPQRPMKVQGDANPFDPAWETYCQHRHRHLTRQASSPGRTTDSLRPSRGVGHA